MGVRSTSHVGYEVRDHSGRHGYPATTHDPDRGSWYHAMELEFAMVTRPNWVFTTQVGQPGYGRLTMPNPPDAPHLAHLDTWVRGPDSDDDGCDTERNSGHGGQRSPVAKGTVRRVPRVTHSVHARHRTRNDQSRPDTRTRYPNQDEQDGVWINDNGYNYGMGIITTRIYFSLAQARLKGGTVMRQAQDLANMG